MRNARFLSGLSSELISFTDRFIVWLLSPGCLLIWAFRFFSFTVLSKMTYLVESLAFFVSGGTSLVILSVFSCITSVASLLFRFLLDGL